MLHPFAFKDLEHFKSLYGICYSIDSVSCFGFQAIGPVDL